MDRPILVDMPLYRLSCRSLQKTFTVRAESAIPFIRNRPHSQSGVTDRIRNCLLGHH